MNIQRLEYFVAVVATGSFTEAAEAIYTTQSNVSKQINSLERELNVKLFFRSNRSVTLTSEGKIVHEYAEQILADQKEMVGKINDLKVQLSCIKSISLAIPPVFRLYGIDKLLDSFQTDYPAISILPEEREVEEMGPSIMNGEIDMAFVPKVAIDEDKHDCILFAKDQLVVLMHRSHKLAKSEAVQMIQLKDESFILLGKSTGLNNLSVSLCNKRGFSPITKHTSSHPDNIAKIIKREKHIALLMSNVAISICDDDIVAVPIIDGVEASFLIVRAKEKLHTQAAELFWEYAKNYYDNMD